MQTHLEPSNFEIYLDELEKALGSLSDVERAEWREEMRQHLMAIYDKATMSGESKEVAIQRAIAQFGETESLGQLAEEEQFATRKTHYRHIFWGTLMGMPFIGIASFYAESLSVKYYDLFGFTPKSIIAILVYLLLLSCLSGLLHAISMRLSGKSSTTQKLSAFFSALAFSTNTLSFVVFGKNWGIALILCLLFALQMSLFIRLFYKGITKFSRQTA
jgi:hypothetical protein